MRPNPREFVAFAGKFRVFFLLILRQNRLKSHKFAVSHRKNGQAPKKCRPFCLVERGVKRVEVFGIESVSRDAQTLAEALVMHNLALAQELDGVAHIGIIRKAQNVVIRYAGLLLGGEIFVDVCQRVARYGDARRTERRAGGRCRVNARRVVDEIHIKALLLNLLLRQIPRQLVHDCPHHLEMSKFFGAYIRDRNAPVSLLGGQAVEFWT